MLSPVQLASHTWDGSRSVSQPGHSLLDALMPAWDTTRVEWRIVPAPPSVVYNITIGSDLREAARVDGSARVLLAVREGFERVAGVLPPRRAAAGPPTSLRLADLPPAGACVLLDSAPPNEIVFGAIGRVRVLEPRWESIDRTTFATLERPGYVKIGCNLLLRSLEDGRTAIACEVRTRATDAAARRAFLRSWRLVSPLAGMVMRSTLARIADRAMASEPR